MTAGGLLTLGGPMALVAASGVGPLRHQHTLHLHVGGAESNVAISVTRLGGHAAWIGRGGDDELGDLVLTQLRGEGVDVRHAVRDDGGPTGLMVKSRRTSTVGRVAYYRQGSAGSRLEPADLPLDTLRAAGVLHVTGITPALSPSARAATFAAVEEARAAGVPVSLDVNHRAALWTADEAGPVLAELAARADVLFAGDDEAGLLGATGDPEAIVKALSAHGPAQVVLKLGARGALASLDGEIVRVP